MFKVLKNLQPLQLLIYGYLLILILGFLLLCLPFFHLTSAPVIDHFFIATSAVSTTGLATVTVPEVYNFGGQLIIMILILDGNWRFSIGYRRWYEIDYYYCFICSIKKYI